MLPEAQARILRWLGPFADGLRDAWDVPRDLSLPGMAEGLGLVRSALHVPLSHLIDDGLVTVRSAHVIGGGRRRRSVHHLTEEGRRVLDALESPDEEPVKTGRWIGDQGPAGPAFGREADATAIHRLLNEHKAAVLTGLAGVGKSTVARCAAEAWRTGGGHVRWANLDAYAGLSDVASVLNGATSFGDDASAAEWLGGCSSSDLIVLDGCEHMHDMHAPSIWKAVGSSAKGPTWLIVGRAPLESPESVPRKVLNPLDDEAAKHILGDVEDGALLLRRREVVHGLVRAKAVSRGQRNHDCNAARGVLGPHPRAGEQLFTTLLYLLLRRPRRRRTSTSPASSREAQRLLQPD